MSLEKMNKTAVGLVVRSLRLSFSMSATTLSGRTGITKSGISRVESGTKMLSLEEAYNITLTFNTDVPTLIELSQKIAQRGILLANQEANVILDRVKKDAQAAVLENIDRSKNLLVR